MGDIVPGTFKLQDSFVVTGFHFSKRKTAEKVKYWSEK